MAKAQARVRMVERGNTRKRTSAAISQRKAKHKRVSAWKRRGLIGGASLAMAYAAFGVWWLYAHDSIAKAERVASQYWWGITAEAGFRVHQVYLEGREHVPASSVMQALAVKQGDAILALDLDRLHARLSALPEVRSVYIRRQLPGSLHVQLQERTPAALWQRAGAHAIIDAEGVVLSRPMSSLAPDTLLVVGDDAPAHMKELTSILAAVPTLRRDVEAAVRVGERRWNVKLRQGITVMLPEADAAAAWARFAAMAEAERLLGKAIAAVDMRLEDRVFITPLQDNATPKLIQASARDT